MVDEEDGIPSEKVPEEDEAEDPYTLKVKRPEKDKDGNPVKDGAQKAAPTKRHASLSRVFSLTVPEIPMLVVAMIALVVSSGSFLAMPAFFGQVNIFEVLAFFRGFFRSFSYFSC